MIRWVWFGIFAAIGGALTACGDKASVASSTMETENSIVAYNIQLAGGTPAANMRVLVRPADYIANTTSSLAANQFADDSTNENGVVELVNLAKGSYMIEVRGGDTLKAASSFSVKDKDSSSYAMTVHAPGRLAGYVKLAQGQGPVQVSIVGLEYQVTTDSTGYFEFESLPIGFHDVVYRDAETNKLSNSISVKIISEASSVITISSKAEKPSTPEVKPDPSTKDTIAPVIPADSTESNDSVEVETPIVYADTLPFEFFENGIDEWYVSYSRYATGKLTLDSSESYIHGKSAHFEYSNDSTYGWALMGRSLRGERDFSTLDSITFWARGNGGVSVAFDRLVDSVSSGKSGKAWIHVKLDTVWKHYSISTNSLLKADSIGGNIGWDAVKDRVTNITFFGKDGSYLDIDNIVLYGVKENILMDVEEDEE